MPAGMVVTGGGALLHGIKESVQLSLVYRLVWVILMCHLCLKRFLRVLSMRLHMVFCCMHLKKIKGPLLMSSRGLLCTEFFIG